MDKRLKSASVAWDWKASGEEIAEELEKALAKFGLVLTEHPATEGSDTYGYIISNRKLNKEELKEAENEQ